MTPLAPIGVFDSGVGGLGVLAAARGLLPHERFVYVADQRFAPYGERPLDEVRQRAFAVARWMIGQHAKMIVVACNTASAAALHELRHELPALPIVGMEPAVKPAARQSRAGCIGVLATAATFQGRLFADLVSRFAQGVDVQTVACPEIVRAVEAGTPDDPALEAVLRERFAPLRARGVDQLVLGCTHFPFARDAIARAAGPSMALVDPAPAVARQIVARLQTGGLPATHPADTAVVSAFPEANDRFVTTGDPAHFESLARRLLGIAIRAEAWDGV